MEKLDDTNVSDSITDTQQNAKQEPISIIVGRWAIEELTSCKNTYPGWTQIDLLEEECIITSTVEEELKATMKGKWKYDQENRLLRITCPELVGKNADNYGSINREREKKNEITSPDHSLLAKYKARCEQLGSDLVYIVKSGGKDFVLLEDSQGKQYRLHQMASTTDTAGITDDNEAAQNKQSRLGYLIEENRSVENNLNKSNSLIEGSIAADNPNRGLDQGNMSRMSDSAIQEVLSAISRIESTVTQQSEKKDRTFKIIENLETEVKRLKTREDERRLEPILRAVIVLFDDVHRIGSDIEREYQQNNVDSERVIRRLRVLEQQVVELLRRQHAIDYAPDIGEKFDAKRHDVLERVRTQIQEDDLKIQSVYRKGYEYADRILRPAGVAILSYDKGSKEQKQAKEEH
jgi:molecular chaperone GrpE (heat shock protein)